MRTAFGLLATLVLTSSCVAAQPAWQRATPAGEVKAAAVDPQTDAMLESIERAHFQFFVDQADPQTGLVKDRSTPASACSIACVGFALTAYPIAANRGWISRQQAASYALRVMTTMDKLPQGPAPGGVGGYRGWFYHFIDMHTGLRMWNSELSTIDTGLMMAGVRFARTYFDRPEEQPIRDVADHLWNNVQWNWARNGQDTLTMGWNPESGFISARWNAPCEAAVLILQGLGASTDAMPDGSWQAFMRTASAKDLYGQHLMPFPPLFGHQYSHAWVDFRGIRDGFSQQLGCDYFENSRRAVLAQHAYALANPGHWKDYSALDWGLTACDGPGNVTVVVDGQPRKLDGYSARGCPEGPDDGTIAPTAAAASLPFAPELVVPTLQHWRKDRPELWGADGFADAFNPTAGWVDDARLGIDQGPIVLMTENYRSGMVWSVMRRDPALRRGLQRAGFGGGWLAGS